jgi:CRISPR-associated protein Csn2
MAELESIKEFSDLQNLTILLLEPRKITGFPQYVLDSDYFLYMENMV